MEEEAWDRREEDRKWKEDLIRRLESLEGQLEEGLEKLGDEVERLKEAVVGGLTGEEGLKVRVSRIETEYQEMKVIASTLAKTIHGDVLGRGSLVDTVKQAASDAADAKKIAQGKIEVQTTVRGQNISVIVAIISLIGVLAMAAFTNWDRVWKSFRRESPQEKLERIKREIEEEKRTRGPAIREKLQEIERAARWR